MKAWILTSEYNEYDQFGEYFIAWFKDKPTREMLAECGVPLDTVDHVHAGGGRSAHYEYRWWHLRQVDEGYVS